VEKEEEKTAADLAWLSFLIIYSGFLLPVFSVRRGWLAIAMPGFLRLSWLHWCVVVWEGLVWTIKEVSPSGGDLEGASYYADGRE
jgi:hypothetical protein